MSIEEQATKLYIKLARKVIATIPVEWETAYYLGEVEKGKSSWSSVFYFYDTGRGEFVQSNSIPKLYQVPKNIYMNSWMEMNQILLDVYQLFAENGRPLWEQLHLSVTRAGKFHAKCFYDVMHPDDGGQLARELVWAHNTFGYTPADGTWEKKTLDKYL